MDTFIGFLELVAWAICVLALAAAVTYTVIRLFPSRDERPPQGDGEPDTSRS